MRELVARLINGRADLVALTRSTAHGISLLAPGLDWKNGDNVVGALLGVSRERVPLDGAGLGWG